MREGEYIIVWRGDFELTLKYVNQLVFNLYELAFLEPVLTKFQTILHRKTVRSALTFVKLENNKN